MTLGAACGPTIITQVVQTLIYKLALGYDLAASVAGERVHHPWKPNVIFADSAFTDKVLGGLVGRGHSVRTAGSFGGTQAIALDKGHFVAITEPRVVKRNNQ